MRKKKGEGRGGNRKQEARKGGREGKKRKNIPKPDLFIYLFSHITV